MRIRVAGHSLHPMLVAFPLGLLVTSVAWDIVFLVTVDPMWAMVAFWTIIGGLVGGLLAAVPGFLDWLHIPAGTRAKRIGWWHMLLNVALLGMFALSAALRWNNGYDTPGIGEMIWGWLALVIGAVSAWLGGELVERLGVGVHHDAHLDAPSSLASRHLPHPK